MSIGIQQKIENYNMSKLITPTQPLGPLTSIRCDSVCMHNNQGHCTRATIVLRIPQSMVGLPTTVSNELMCLSRNLP